MSVLISFFFIDNKTNSLHIDRLSTELDEARKKLTTYELKHREQSQLLQELTAAKDEAVEKNNSLKSELSSRLKELGQLKEMASKLEEEKAALIDKNCRLEIDSSQNQARSSELQVQIADGQTQIQRNEATIDELKKSIASLQAEMRETFQLCEGLENDLQFEQNQTEKKSVQVDKLSAEKAELEKKLGEASKQIDLLREAKEAAESAFTNAAAAASAKHTETFSSSSAALAKNSSKKEVKKLQFKFKLFGLSFRDVILEHKFRLEMCTIRVQDFLVFRF